MKITAFCFLLCCAFGMTTGQEAVYFNAVDGVTVRGDLYLRNNGQPFIILCHQAGSNRSEYSDIAAAIRFVQLINQKPVILFGSSYSASLCLLASLGNPRVRAVVAFSPGEYFLPLHQVKAEMGKVDKQVFIGSTQTEFSYMQQLTRDIPSNYLTLFKPAAYQGIQGSKALGNQAEGNEEYWFALMMFFKKVTGDEGQCQPTTTTTITTITAFTTHNTDFKPQGNLPAVLSYTF